MHLNASWHSRTWLVLGLTLVGLSAAGWYLFRIDVVDNSALGRLEYRYRWGRRAEALADTNRDGVVDVRAILENGFLLKEMWEDTNHDGIFDRHTRFAGTSPVEVRLDRDGDGIYETVMKGADAQRFFSEHGLKHIETIY